MFKKILLIFGFLIVVFGIGFAIYFVFFRAPAEKPPLVAPPAAPPAAGLPLAKPGAPVPPTKPGEIVPLPKAQLIARGGITQTTALTTAKADGAVLSSDGLNLQYYSKNEGKFYRLTPDGQLSPMADKIFYNVENVSWAPDTKKAVLEYPDGSNILYNFETLEQTTLPKHWEDFEFSSKSDKIVSKSIALDPKQRWLIISSPDGSNVKAIEPLGDNADKVELNWSPSDQVIAISRTGESQEFGREQVYFIGKNNEKFRAITAEGINFKGIWSPTGERLLYSVADQALGFRPTLWIIDSYGDAIGLNRHKLNLNTWADKCVFKTESAVYCAVPEKLEEGAGLLPQVSDTVPDVFYKINVLTGAKSFLGATEERYTVDKIMVSDDESLLYFTDKATGQLHKMRLK